MILSIKTMMQAVKRILFTNPFEEQNKMEMMPGYDPWSEPINDTEPKKTRKRQTKKKPAPMAVYKKKPRKAKKAKA